MEFLFRKLGEWLYDRMQPRRALSFADRLEALLDGPMVKVSAVDASILGNEMRAEIAEARQDWVAEARFRRRKIQLLDKLRATAKPTDEVTRDYLVPLSELAHNYVALAVALRDAGRSKTARSALTRAEQLFRAAGTKFPYKWLELEIEKPGKPSALGARRRRNLRRAGTFVPFHGRQ